MILLFRDNSVNYWLNNTVVDCGKADTPQEYLDIELPEDISLDEIEPEITNNKKLNFKVKHMNDPIINESNYEKIYFGRNTKATNGNPRKKDSRSKFNGYKHKYKNTNTGINDTQETVKYRCVQEYFSSNFDQRQMREMPKNSSLYSYE